ncbi:hypothetical protein NBRC116492_29790 [Aurantivibrio infirmus]
MVDFNPSNAYAFRQSEDARIVKTNFPKNKCKDAGDVGNLKLGTKKFNDIRNNSLC